MDTWIPLASEDWPNLTEYITLQILKTRTPKEIATVVFTILFYDAIMLSKDADGKAYSVDPGKTWPRGYKKNMLN